MIASIQQRYHHRIEYALGPFIYVVRWKNREWYKRRIEARKEIKQVIKWIISET